MLDDRDEELRRRARHVERIERMRQEKERREKLNRRVRQFLPLGAGILGIMVLAIIVSIVLGKKSTRNEELSIEQANLATKQTLEQVNQATKQTLEQANQTTEQMLEQANQTTKQTLEQANQTTKQTLGQADLATEYAINQTSEQTVGTGDQTAKAAAQGSTMQEAAQGSTMQEAAAQGNATQGTTAQGSESATQVVSIPEKASPEAAVPGNAIQALTVQGSNATTGSAAQETVTPVYNFESTEDTKTIYSDKVISANAILIDESTDKIIASKGARERISPASMTKVLTVLVAAEHISKEDLNDTFTMTLEITDYAYVNDCSSVGFLDGEKVKVRDLFYGTILPSGGDAAVGLATYVAGSHEAFVDLMNEKLKDLGLSDSAHFTNCVGLYDEEHYCTVYDMAVIMKAAMQNEMCREFLSAHTYTTTPTVEHPEGITISNWFLRRIEDKDTGGEVLCAKTGYVVESKNCAVSYGTFKGQTPYICVTAGASSSWKCIYDHVEIYNQYISE